MDDEVGGRLFKYIFTRVEQCVFTIMCVDEREIEEFPSFEGHSQNVLQIGQVKPSSTLFPSYWVNETFRKKKELVKRKGIITKTRFGSLCLPF